MKGPIEVAIDLMWDEIEAIYGLYGFRAQDWPEIRRASPMIFERIDELERVKPTTLEEVLRIQRSLKLNYERAFMRGKRGRDHGDNH